MKKSLVMFLVIGLTVVGCQNGTHVGPDSKPAFSRQRHRVIKGVVGWSQPDRIDRDKGCVAEGRALGVGDGDGVVALIRVGRGGHGVGRGGGAGDGSSVEVPLVGQGGGSRGRDRKGEGDRTAQVNRRNRKGYYLPVFAGGDCHQSGGRNPRSDSRYCRC